MFDERIKLISRAAGEDAVTVTETERGVWAKAETPTQTEYYKALTAGLKAEITLTIHKNEYKGEAFLEWKGKRYEILRTQEKDRAFMKLVCGESLS